MGKDVSGKKKKNPKTEMEFAKNSLKSYRLCFIVFIILVINFVLTQKYINAGLAAMAALAFGSLTFVYTKKIAELSEQNK